jgi:hypothetical protein
MPDGNDESLHGARLTLANVFDEETTVDEALSVASDETKGRWLVVVGRAGQPLAVLPPQALKSIASTAQSRPLGAVAQGSRTFLIAEITTTFGSVMDQAREFDLAPGAAILVVDGHEIRGISTVDRLQSDLVTVSYAGSTLPGRPQIPVLARHCEYAEPGVRCTHVGQFQTKPPLMPPCPNPLHLRPHDFVW